MRLLLILCFCCSVLTTFGQSAEYRITTGLVGDQLFSAGFFVRFPVNSTLTNVFYIEQNASISPYLGIEKLHENGWRQSWSILRADFSDGDFYIVNSDPSLGVFEPASGEVRKQISLNLRWASGKTITPLSGERFVTSLSLAADPFLLYYRSIPNTSAAFPFTFTQVGVTGSLLPQFEYRITSRLGVVLQTPITLGRIYWQKAYLQNPVLTEPQKANTLTNAEVKLRPNQLLLGVSYKL
ncbi:hypothetical protein [Lewinella sp. LCG006]|uniref:hypothetical protein n=1 Tax=Lewinella sp. LCG006 TaxID=3231911 RepID=UPI003460954C